MAALSPPDSAEGCHAMDGRMLRRGPRGRELLAASPAAMTYFSALAPIVFPDGLPSPAAIDLARRGVWAEVLRRDEQHPAGVAAWDPATEAELQVGDAFRRGGLAAAIAVAIAHEGVRPGTGLRRPRVSTIREIGSP